MSAAPALVLRGVACRRGGRMLFEGLDLELAPGGAALVTGPNGAGKSSLIRVAAGLLAAELLLRRARARLGGVTGDVMGAVGETAATVTLLVAAAAVT